MERRTGHEEKTCSHQCMPFILDIESTNHSPFDTMGACGDVWDVLKIYWSLLLGNILEWYEFAIFAFLEPYLQSNFFHGSAITTWLGFASTFLARPFGGLVLGILGDLFGRKVSTFLSILGMLIGTVGQGMVPTYQSGQICGTIGVVLLVVFRILQGICTGGEIAAVSTYITEVGAKHSLARCMVLIGITCTMGLAILKVWCFPTIWPSSEGKIGCADWPALDFFSLSYCRNKLDKPLRSFSSVCCSLFGKLFLYAIFMWQHLQVHEATSDFYLLNLQATWYWRSWANLPWPAGAGGFPSLSHCFRGPWRFAAAAVSQKLPALCMHRRRLLKQLRSGGNWVGIQPKITKALIDCMKVWQCTQLNSIPKQNFQNISEVCKSLEVLSFQVDRDRPSVKATDCDGQRRYSFAKGRSETLPNGICWFFARQERLRPFKMPKVRWKHSSRPIGQQCGLASCQLQPLRLYTMLRCHGAMYFFRKEVLQVPVWSWSLALQKTEWVFLVVVAYIHIRRARMPENQASESFWHDLRNLIKGVIVFHCSWMFGYVSWGWSDGT